MYDFATKKAISRRIADKQYIPIYRGLLEACRVPSSGMRMADQDALAKDLVYVLLDKYTEEQILAACRPSPAASGRLTSEVTKTASEGGPAVAVKKKSRNLRNIPESIGRTWTTLSSALRTASSRTASTAGRVCASLKNSFRNLRRNATSSSNT